MAIYGLLFNGPFLHFMYTKVYPRLGTGDRAIFYKIAFNQTFQTIPAIAIFYCSISLMRGLSIDEAIAEMQAKAWDTLVWSWKTWPVIHLMTFKFVPVHLQVLWVNGW